MAYQSVATLDELRSFVEVVEAGGFTAATKRSGARKATLSRRVQELERRIGAKLLARTTRSIRLTDQGQLFFHHASRAVQAAKEAHAAVERSMSTPSGVLRVSTTAGLAGLVLEDVVVTYVRDHPNVSVDLDISQTSVDLVRDGFDVAVRVGELQDSALGSIGLGKAYGGYYAGPGYLARRGTPTRVNDLDGHDLLAIPRGPGPIEWSFVVHGKHASYLARPRLRTSSFELAVRAAVANLGIVFAPDTFVQEHLHHRRLVPVLAKLTQPGVQVHAVMPPGGMLAPKTRVFVELLRVHFAKNARRQEPRHRK
jgi:DNA-binding transcriptional LysR family regulator